MDIMYIWNKLIAIINENILSLLAGIIGAILGAIIWEIARSPRITLESVQINNPEEFKIRLRNKGWKEVSECIVTLKTCQLPETNSFLNELIKPPHKRVESYLLEDVDEPILYSCWPITRDVILPSMTDMKPGPGFDFVGQMPDFLRKKQNLAEGDWTKTISFPKIPGIYIGVVTVYDGADVDFVGIYEYAGPESAPKWLTIGRIRWPRRFYAKWLYWRIRKKIQRKGQELKTLTQRITHF